MCFVEINYLFHMLFNLMNMLIIVYHNKNGRLKKKIQ